MPPGTSRDDQFAPGTAPNLARAATFQGLGAWWDVFDWSPTFSGRPMSATPWERPSVRAALPAATIRINAPVTRRRNRGKGLM